MGKLFGTDGVRGVANEHPMTVEMATRLGKALAFVLRREKPDVRHRVVIGKDTRLSGYMFETALAAGLCSMGADVHLVGPHPTPGIAYLTQSLRADAGIVISASHNPYQDNGIKLFGRDGFKLPDPITDEIEDMVLSSRTDALRFRSHRVGKAYKVNDALGRYIVFLKNTFPKDLSLQGVRVVIDCANGASYRLGPMVLEELGAEVIAINVGPNGENINLRCGSTAPAEMRAAVVEKKAHLGIALDGDGDRAVFADEKGRLIDGDQVLGICARDMQRHGKLHDNTIVATVVSNIGLDIAMKKIGVKVKRVRVGDRYVVEEMLRGGYTLGGEQSGHMVFLDHNTTGDGMIAALQVLSIMGRSASPASVLAASVPRLPQEQINVGVKEKKDFSALPGVPEAIRKAEAGLGGRGRVLVRYSGTEPLVRIMVEGENASAIRKMAAHIASALRRAQGRK